MYNAQQLISEIKYLAERENIPDLSGLYVRIYVATERDFGGHSSIERLDFCKPSPSCPVPTIDIVIE